MSLTLAGGASAPPSLDELWALRSDYRDVAVEELGGTTLRVYALTGTARAELLSEMADLAGSQLTAEQSTDPAIVRRVLVFQGNVVAAALGYPRDQWQGVGSTLGTSAIERLYEVAAELSGLDKDEQDKATARLGKVRKNGSGTG